MVKRRNPKAPKRRFRRRRVFKKFAKRPLKNVSLSANIPMIQKFRYVTGVEITSSVGLMSSHVFRANSCFDPDQTGTGHQPNRWDQMTVFWNKYVVLGAKISATMVGTSTTADTRPSLCFGLLLTDSTSFPTEYTTLAEQGRGNFKLTNTSNAMRAPWVSAKFSAKRFFNVKNIKDNFDYLGAAVTTNPSNDAYFILYQQPVTQAAGDTATARYLVYIDYIVMFSEPKSLAQS